MRITLRKSFYLAAILGLSVAATSQAEAATCSYAVSNQGASWFGGTITITNNTTTAINGWTVGWQYAANKITNSWNSTLTGSNPYSATALSWNSNIQPGQSVSFGFQGDKNNTAAAEIPTVTGSVCSGTPASSTATSINASSKPKSSIPTSSKASSSSAVLTERCNWYGQNVNLCVTTPSGWGYENNASCVARTTCAAQPAPYGIVGAASSIASSTARSSSSTANLAPTAVMTASTYMPTGCTTNGKASAALSTDPEGDALTYAWVVSYNQYGTSETSFNFTGAEISFGMIQIISYKITLTVTDGKGGSSTVTKSLSHSNTDYCVASSSKVGSNSSRSSVRSSIAPSSIPTSSRASSVTSSYDSCPQNPACTSSRSSSSAANRPPVAVIASPGATFLGNNPVNFSAVGSSDPDGDPLTYEWNIKGTILTGLTVSVNLSGPGSTAFTLTVSDGRGGVTTISRSVFVGEGSSSQRSSNSSASAKSSIAPSSKSVASSVSSSVSTSATIPPSNPFMGATWYVDPIWSAKAGAETNGSKIAQYNTAVWMDRIGAIAPTDGSFGLRDHLNAALAQNANLIQIVIYDLPNRDCHALASNGELLASDPTSSTRYRTEYVDAIAAIFADSKYSSLRIIAIIEPDSLPNLVTNLTDPDCALAASGPDGYVPNTQYTLNKLYSLKNVYSYMDIGHSGWLGWDDNMAQAVTLIANTVKGTTHGVNSIAGFVSNTAGYTPNIEPFLDAYTNTALPGSNDGTQVRSAKFYEWNMHFSEISFVKAWRTKMIAAGFPSSIGMLIDTSRNGWGGAARPSILSASADLETFVNSSRVDKRSHRGNWCNQKSGLGERPQAVNADGIQAYVWVKPPGESDGAASLALSYDPQDPAKGFDQMCNPTYMHTENGSSLDSGAMADAPVAGRWFSAGFQQLLNNAYPPL